MSPCWPRLIRCVLALFCGGRSVDHESYSRQAVAELKALGRAGLSCSQVTTAPQPRPSPPPRPVLRPGGQSCCLHPDKLQAIESENMQRKAALTAMTGCINDACLRLANAAPALHMGGAGTDTAMEAADIGDHERRSPHSGVDPPVAQDARGAVAEHLALPSFHSSIPSIHSSIPSMSFSPFHSIPSIPDSRAPDQKGKGGHSHGVHLICVLRCQPPCSR